LTLTKEFVNNERMLSPQPSLQLFPQPRPTEGELAILRVLWEQGPLSVRDVQRIMHAARPTGYTTVLKLLQVMTEKKLVERDETKRPQIYRPCFTQEKTQRQLLQDLMQRAFGGSMKALVMQALPQGKASAEELKELEGLLDRLEAKK
jgi:predicted transcriptional regulator